MPQLLLTTADGQARSVSLEGDSLTLGRSPENTLSFPEDGSLSRKHLVIEREGDAWTVSDLGSKNGTFVNGQRITGRCSLQAGDRICAGGVAMIYEVSTPLERAVVFEAPPPDESSLSTRSVLLSEVLSSAPSTCREPAEVTAADQLWLFVRAFRELAVGRPLQELFQTILDFSIEAVGAERGLLLTLDEGDRLVVQASSGEDFRISTAVRDRVLRERTSLLVEDVMRHDSLLGSQTITRQRVRSLLAVPLQTDDRVIGMIYLDSTEPGRKFTADDLNLLTAMSNVASIRIERESWESQRRALIEDHVATLERLAAALSHELNSPLGALKSTMDTLARLSARQPAPTGESHPAALEASLRGVLAASIERIQQVVARMQRLTSLDKADIQAADLNELLRDAASLLDAAPDQERVQVELDFETLPPVLCRVRRLSMVLSNVLRNATEACRQGSVSPGKIRVSTRARRGQVEVRIEDNGLGIASDDLGRIFDPGFRVVEGRVAAGNWSLFSCRQLVREQGGDIRISSQPGRGTTVCISLPCQPPAG